MDALQQPKASAPGFTIDTAQMLRLVNVRGKWHSLFRAHLYLDHLVSGMLEDRCAHTDYVQASQNTLFNRVQLAFGLGLLPRPMLAPVRRVIALHDDMARSLEMTISAREIAALRAMMPAECMGIAAAHGVAGGAALGQCLAALVLTLDAIREANRGAGRAVVGVEMSMALAVLRPQVPEHPGARVVPIRLAAAG
ncbi:hypothetical protein C8P66_1011 [Humitalea rosea]|uniref:Uncharacterized protein n=1 Tax=Humitalea rosea TaxID=990373 RepID=A0A2W7IVJ6_9PROT|nr:hypothetical protein [Humitalea rosea]PZW50788.1 hypothetical protein C8P66_1011 [Humitalea rosea]